MELKTDGSFNMTLTLRDRDDGQFDLTVEDGSGRADAGRITNPESALKFMVTLFKAVAEHAEYDGEIEVPVR